MARGAWWIVAGLLLLLLFVCGGGWTSLVLGPLLVLWVFLSGPPDIRCSRSLAGTAFLLVLGVLLTINGLTKLPLPW